MKLTARGASVEARQLIPVLSRPWERRGRRRASPFDQRPAVMALAARRQAAVRGASQARLWPISAFAPCEAGSLWVLGNGQAQRQPHAREGIVVQSAWRNGISLSEVKPPSDSSPGLKVESQGDRMLPNNTLKLTSPLGSCRTGSWSGLAA